MMELFPEVLYLGFHSTSKHSGYASSRPGAGVDEFGEVTIPADRVSISPSGVVALYCRRWPQRGIEDFYRVVPYQLVEGADDMFYDVRYLEPGDTSAVIDGYEIHYVYPSEIE